MPFINPMASKPRATRAMIAAAADAQIAQLEAQIQRQEVLLATRRAECTTAWEACHKAEAKLSDARITPQALRNTLRDAYREAQAALRDAQTTWLAVVRFGGEQFEELRRPILVTK